MVHKNGEKAMLIGGDGIGAQKGGGDHATSTGGARSVLFRADKKSESAAVGS